MKRLKTIRVFISSTFKDMHSERDLLVRFVFPELKERCLKRGLYLVDIDLRWGVTEEEAKTGQIIKICLDEIDRSRPFFIGFLGERYGYVSESYDTPAEKRFDWLKDLKKGYSITALEILYGVLKNPDMKERAFFYLRDPSFIKDVPSLKLSDVRADNKEAVKKLKRLKTKIREIYEGAEENLMLNYPAVYKGLKFNWPQLSQSLINILNNNEMDVIEKSLDENDVITNDKYKSLIDEKTQECVNQYGVIYLEGLDELKDRVLNDIWHSILEEYPEEIIEPDEVAFERSFHENFILSITRRFIGRKDILHYMNNYVREMNDRPLIIFGEPGTGKSALLSYFVSQISEEYDDIFIIPHFVGASPDSVDIHKTLIRIIKELINHFDLTEYTDLPTEYEQIRDTFLQILKGAGIKKKVLIVIDALNQLNEKYHSHSLNWIPNQLPSGTKIVLSTGGGDVLESARLKKLIEFEMTKLTREERKTIVQETLGEYRKNLSWDVKNKIDQLETLLSKKESYKPLYLKIFCEELRIFPQYELISTKIISMKDTIQGLFEDMFERLEKDNDKTLVEKTLVFIECSRSGLLESEMLGLLRRDDEQPLPVNQWAKLFHGLSMYLKILGEEGDGFIDFFHQQLSHAVRRRYLENDAIKIEYHQKLANYFKSRAQGDANEWDGTDIRGFSELPYHLMKASNWVEMTEILVDLNYLLAKTNFDLIHEVFEELTLTYEIFMKIDKLKAESLLRSLLNLVAVGDQTETPITIDYLHAFFAYKYQDNFRQYYEAFLNFSRNKKVLLDALKSDQDANLLQMEVLAKYANVKRRDCVDLSTVESILKDYIEKWSKYIKKPTPDELKKLARVEYDVGYVNYLQGNFQEAVENFDKSALHASEANDTVGKFISTIVGYRVRYYGKIGSLSEFKEVLMNAHSYFREYSTGPKKNQHAIRWITNVNAHLFEVAFEENNKYIAREQLEKLEDDPWVKAYASPFFLKPYYARLALMEGKYTKAINDFNLFLQSLEIKDISEAMMESLSRDYLDLGKALAYSGDIEKAIEIWQDGLKTPDNNANIVWKERITKLLEQYQ